MGYHICKEKTANQSLPILRSAKRDSKSCLSGRIVSSVLPDNALSSATNSSIAAIPSRWTIESIVVLFKSIELGMHSGSLATAAREGLVPSESVSWMGTATRSRERAQIVCSANGGISVDTMRIVSLILEGAVLEIVC